MKAALYLRVSTDDGRQTTANQRPALEQMARARGYEITRTFEDEESGAKGKRDRPGLAALLQAAARGEFSAVLVWALDRFSRDDSFTGGLLMIGELDHYRVALLSHQETWLDTAGPFREPLVALSLKMAASERRRLIDRTRAGMARARAEGKHIGRKPGKRIAPGVSVPLSEAVLARAAELRREKADRPRQSGYGPPSWRRVHLLLELEGVQNLPDFSTLARACVKAYPDLPRGKWRGGGRSAHSPAIVQKRTV